MTFQDPPGTEPPPGIAPLLAADIQDHLMVATNDLERLGRLIGDASQALMESFFGASSALAMLEGDARALDPDHLASARRHVAAAITAMQFQDLATQLLDHTTRRMRRCADKLAVEAMGPDDEDGQAIVEDAPMRPNPVTQDEVDAGAIELF